MTAFRMTLYCVGQQSLSLRTVTFQQCFPLGRYRSREMGIPHNHQLITNRSWFISQCTTMGEIGISKCLCWNGWHQRGREAPQICMVVLFSTFHRYNKHHYSRVYFVLSADECSNIKTCTWLVSNSTNISPIDSLFSPSKYETWTDVVSMSGQSRRRWTNIQTTSGRRSVLARNV